MHIRTHHPFWVWWAWIHAGHSRLRMVRERRLVLRVSRLGRWHAVVMERSWLRARGSIAVGHQMRWRSTIRWPVDRRHTGRRRRVVGVINPSRPLRRRWRWLLRRSWQWRSVLIRWTRRRTSSNWCHAWTVRIDVLFRFNVLRLTVLSHLLSRTRLAWEWRCWSTKGLPLFIGIGRLRWIDVTGSLAPAIGRCRPGRRSMRAAGPILLHWRRTSPRRRLWSLSSIGLGVNVGRHSLRETSRGLTSPQKLKSGFDVRVGRIQLSSSLVRVQSIVNLIIARLVLEGFVSSVVLVGAANQTYQSAQVIPNLRYVRVQAYRAGIRI